MRRIPVLALALALVACAEPKPAMQTGSADREVRQGNRLPAQMARNMESPYQGIGCLWPISLSPERIAAPNELSATCRGLGAGRPYELLINARVPAETGEGSRVTMRLLLVKPGNEQEMVVAYDRRMGRMALFSGAASGIVPNGGVVEARLSLIGCEDETGVETACVVESGSLFVLSNR